MNYPPPITRRRAITQGAAALLAPPIKESRTGDTSLIVTVGAIRWDAWQASNGDAKSAVETTLGPARYHYRSPFCAEERATNLIEFTHCSEQSSFDIEIEFASRAGLAYWAYCWYPLSNPLMNGWRLHQSSKRRNDINWCMLWQLGWLEGEQSFNEDTPSFVEYFKQTNYQKVGAGRPLVYLLVDDETPLRNSWGGDWANLQKAMSRLNAACTGVGLAVPYVVIMQNSVNSAAKIMHLIFADAISSYIGPIPQDKRSSYLELSASTENSWGKMAAAGVSIVPNCMTGWDTRPRKEHPPAWQKEKTPMLGMGNFVEAGKPAEIAGHIEAARQFVRKHPASCPASTVIIYSWDECDEGGSALIPSLSNQGPDHKILDAIKAILKDNNG